MVEGWAKGDQNSPFLIDVIFGWAFDKSREILNIANCDKIWNKFRNNLSLMCFFTSYYAHHEWVFISFRDFSRFEIKGIFPLLSRASKIMNLECLTQGRWMKSRWHLSRPAWDRNFCVSCSDKEIPRNAFSSWMPPHLWASVVRSHYLHKKPPNFEDKNKFEIPMGFMMRQKL